MTESAHRAAATRDTGTEPTSDGDLIDPRAPQFGQGITASVLVLGIYLQLSVLVYAVAVVLGTAVLSRWRLDLYAILWDRVVARFVPPPRQREHAAPHRFAKLIGAVVTVAASLFLLADSLLLGYSLAGLVAILAGLAVGTGFCLGCRLYRQVSFLEQRGWL